MSLTKSRLADSIVKKVGLSVREAKAVVDQFFSIIVESLVNGDAVKIAKFGNFILRDKGERPGCNPKTGEYVLIEKRRVVTFRASEKLKELIAKKIAKKA